MDLIASVGRKRRAWESFLYQTEQETKKDEFLR
jgi:hypothetical protein